MKVLYALGKNKAPFAFIQPLFVEYSKPNSKADELIHSLDFIGHISSFTALLTDNSFKYLVKHTSADIILTCVLGFPSGPNRSQFQFSFPSIKIWFKTIIILCNSFYLILFGLIVGRFKSRFHFTLKQSKLTDYNIAFIAGTQDKTAWTLFKNLDLLLSTKTPFVWLPHAAHHGSYINTLPKGLFQSSRIVDVWLPSSYETLEKNSSNIFAFKSGYIPFSTACLETQRKSILSRAKHVDVTLLLRQFLPSAEPSTYHVSESDIETAIKITRNIVQSKGLANVTICLHPSVSKSYIVKMLKRFNLADWQVTYDYFLDHSGPNTMVIGFYSTVLLHSLALGLNTYAFYDSIFMFLRKHYSSFFDIYCSSSLNFLSLDPAYPQSPSLADLRQTLPMPSYKGLNTLPFEDFLRFSSSSNVACYERLLFLKDNS